MTDELDNLPAPFHRMSREAVARVAADVELPAGVVITEIGLVGLEHATEAQLIELTNGLVYAFERDALSAEIKMWALGDLVNAGEGRYGDTYTEAIEASGMSYQTVANAAYVTRRIPYGHRHSFPLTFTHHARVASLEPDQQDRWLDLALVNEWSSRQLAHAIQAAQDTEAGLDPEIEDVKRVLTRTVENVAGLWPEQWAGTIACGLLRPLRTQDVKDADWRAFLVALQGEIDTLLKEILCQP